jgi:hypothetical protein
MREEKNIKKMPGEEKTESPEEIVGENISQVQPIEQPSRSDIEHQISKNKTWKYIITRM